MRAAANTLAIKTPDNAMAMTKIPSHLNIVEYPEGDYTPTKVLFHTFTTISPSSLPTHFLTKI